MSTKNSTIETIKSNKSKFFKTAKETHTSILEGAEDLVDSGIATGEQWQKLITKTIKNSEPLVNRQMDIFFETFETIQGQFQKGTSRFRSLVGITDADIKEAKEKFNKRVDEAKAEFDTRTKEAKKRFDKAVDNVRNKAEDIADDAQDTASKLAKKVENAVKDDLKVINGIGPKFEKALNKVGVLNFQDLARQDVEQLAIALENNGDTINDDKLESWIERAQSFAK